MSSPYTDSPVASHPTWYLNYNPNPPGTPFIPPVSLPSSPGLSTPPCIRPSTPYDTPYAAYGVHRPLRRLSWHAGIPPSPSLQPLDTPFRYRRHSFRWPYDTSDHSVHDFYWTYPSTSLSPSPSPRFHIHSLLTREASFAGFYFNLASPTVLPLRFIGPGRRFAVISPHELHQPATDPPITRMRISHDVIPQWPIDIGLLSVESGVDTIHPITVGDVLYMVHASLGRKITHRDWDNLTISEQTEIACTYTQRYTNTPSTIEVEALQGVRRVDYLGEKYVFRGLVRVHDEDGLFRWKLIT